ncbi:MAG TPA: hypothetical protein VMN36_13505 [Verrucomicrobiales bacterium]|nr:hypothetical protein [Verrucomicrobiales bacterium]
MLGKPRRGQGPVRSGRFRLFLCCLPGLFPLTALADEAAIRTELDELRRSNQELRSLLEAQQQRTEALEQRLERLAAAPPPAPAPPPPAPAGQPKSAYDAKGVYIEPAPPSLQNLIALKRKGSGSSLLELYGFLRVDGIYDSHQAGLDELLGYAVSPDDRAFDNDDFYLHPKLTRIGADFNGPTLESLGGAKVDGKIEIDFYRQFRESESRDEFRMRHAYLKLAWDQFYLLAGQTFDTISPLYPIINPDFGAWALGNLGDRRPQFIAGYSPKFAGGVLGFVGAVGQSGANSSSEGDDKASYQARLSYQRPLWGGTFHAGFWGHYADEDSYKSDLVGAGLILPLYKDILTFKGEIWSGQNLDDVRGGILQGVVAGEELDSEGLWGELVWKIIPHISLHGGYMIDNPDNDQLVPGFESGSRALNKTWYSSIQFNYDPVLFGLDYIHVDTGFKGARGGELDRIQAFVQYNF